MVPLYAARVQDLGPDDVAVFKCGACGHTAELWPSFLIGGLGLQPTEGARPGTAAGMPAVPRRGAGRGVDQVEGDWLNLSRGGGFCAQRECATGSRGEQTG